MSRHYNAHYLSHFIWVLMFAQVFLAIPAFVIMSPSRREWEVVLLLVWIMSALASLFAYSVFPVCFPLNMLIGFDQTNIGTLLGGERVDYVLVTMT